MPCDMSIEGEERGVTMWYWYVWGAVDFIIGFISYSCLVVARRADDRSAAIGWEEAFLVEVQSGDSASNTDLA